MNGPVDATPLTAVIRRKARPGSEEKFEATMREFAAFAATFPGHRGMAILRPHGAAIGDYIVVDQFDDINARRYFKESPVYQDWLKKLRFFSVEEPHIEELEGLSSWFPPPNRASSPKTPPKWKMGVITFLGVYPLTSFLPPFFSQLLPEWHPLLLNLIVTGVIVGVLNWAIMPILTRKFARWLFVKSADQPRSIFP